MTDRDYDWISRRAYSVWEEEGRPHGRDTEHWNVASGEWDSLQISGDQAKAKTKPRATKAKPSAVDETGAVAKQAVKQATKPKARKS